MKLACVYPKTSFLNLSSHLCSYLPTPEMNVQPCLTLSQGEQPHLSSNTSVMILYAL